MVVPPAEPAVTMPEEEPIDATVPVLLLHVPAPSGSLSIVDVPWQIVNAPDIGDGNGYTVIGAS